MTVTLKLNLENLSLGTREELANKVEDTKVLAKLAKDKEVKVRLAVAKNPHTTSEILAKLAKDNVWLVKLGVAQNPNVSKETLAELAEDERIKE